MACLCLILSPHISCFFLWFFPLPFFRLTTRLATAVTKDNQGLKRKLWDGGECYCETDSELVMVPFKPGSFQQLSLTVECAVQYVWRWSSDCSTQPGVKIVFQSFKVIAMPRQQHWHQLKYTFKFVESHTQTPYQVIDVWRTSLGKNYQRWHHFLGSEEGLVVKVSVKRKNGEKKKASTALDYFLFFFNSCAVNAMASWGNNHYSVEVEVGGHISLQEKWLSLEKLVNCLFCCWETWAPLYLNQTTE